jgi:hypothetical protein
MKSSTTVALEDPHSIRKSFVGIVSYLVGVAVAWISVHVAFLIYLVTPVFFITPPQRRPATSAR